MSEIKIDEINNIQSSWCFWRILFFAAAIQFVLCTQISLGYSVKSLDQKQLIFDQEESFQVPRAIYSPRLTGVYIVVVINLMDSILMALPLHLFFWIRKSRIFSLSGVLCCLIFYIELVDSVVAKCGVPISSYIIVFTYYSAILLLLFLMLECCIGLLRNPKIFKGGKYFFCVSIYVLFSRLILFVFSSY